MDTPVRLGGIAATLLAAMSPSAAAQSSVTVPAACSSLPGNAAISMPLRWSHGIMQVFVDPVLLPSALGGQTLQGIRLRRSVLPGDGAYAALQRTLTVRGGFQQPPAAQMIGGYLQNRPPSQQVLFGPAQVSVAATSGPGPTTILGDEFVVIPFNPPLPMATGTLFLEFEAGDAPLQISEDHWVDAVWFEGGVDEGMVVTVGDGSCTTRPEPTRVHWVGETGPVAGGSVTVELRGAPPTTTGTSPTFGFGLIWLGVDPGTRLPGAGYLGYGASFATIDPALVGCQQWAPFDVSWFGATSGAGTYATGFSLPNTMNLGQRLAIQGAWLDLSRPGLPFSFSDGLQLVCRSAAVGNHCNTMYFPAGVAASPWPPFVGQMPVIVFEY